MKNWGLLILLSLWGEISFAQTAAIFEEHSSEDRPSKQSSAQPNLQPQISGPKAEAQSHRKLLMVIREENEKLRKQLAGMGYQFTIQGEALSSSGAGSDDRKRELLRQANMKRLLKKLREKQKAEAKKAKKKKRLAMRKKKKASENS